MDVAPGVSEALKNFVLPETLGFGAVNAPVMFSAEWRDQRWSPGQLLRYGPIAAIVMPIAALADADTRVYRPKETNVIASRLRDSLLAIQERRAPDQFGWIRVIS